MHIPAIFVSALLVLVDAHLEGIPGAPKLVGGRRFAPDLRSRLIYGAPVAVEEREASGPKLENRQVGGTNGKCGKGVGSCAAKYCCSAAGWCGNTEEYCAAPDCQFDYGPGCDANTVPPGTATSGVARPHVGTVLYGGGGVQYGGIYDCVKQGAMALTFDDGPYIYTSHILDVLKSYNAKATFFITGNNLGKGRIDDPATGYPAIIQRMITEGHQIASHTWSHQNLSSLTNQQMKNQMYYNEMAFRNILGYFPTYMRPPFSECNLACESLMDTLGYHITYFDLDTADYLNDDPTLIQNSKNIVDNWLKANPVGSANDDALVIGHDIHQQTAYNLTGYILSRMQATGYGTSITVGQCLGDPSANWYRSAGGSPPASSPPAASSVAPVTSAAPSPSGTTVSPDATCGGTKKYTCLGSSFGNCCSVNGWCGSTTAYCGTGCQSGFGTCGTQPVSSAPPTSSSPAAAKPVSPDGTCGTTYTCKGSSFGTCCSQFGWCGSTTNYCGTGCQPSAGTCT